ncbi:MAG: hypothetical protein QN158_10450, partial [Armatimonadota bacterium]|nr:hypothetical protein [Armatimonadota bacterium]
MSFAGITVAALIRLLGLEALRPVSRMAELLTVVALILAAFSVLPDLGQPLRGIVNLFRYARPQSPFFGTFTLVISGSTAPGFHGHPIMGGRSTWETEGRRWLRRNARTGIGGPLVRRLTRSCAYCAGKAW